MTDRELLELAAKAAGIPYTKPTDDYDGSLGLAIGDNPMRTKLWNPLTDDGDALRLAVKLKIELCFPFLLPQEIDAVRACENTFEPLGDDPYAATRRAIVLAAAEIRRNKDELHIRPH